jgi:hypothetical protein
MDEGAISALEEQFWLRVLRSTMNFSTRLASWPFRVRA